MTNPDPAPNRRQPRKPWQTVSLWYLLFALIACYLGSFAVPIMVFLARDKEVQPIIEGVYLHHYKTGVWPKHLLELDHLEIDGNLAEWRYYGGSRQLPPCLDISGPVHLQLKYVFREDGSSASPGGWYAYCEGDRIAKTFHERIPARIGPNSSNHFFEYTPQLVIPKNWRTI